MSRRSLLYGVSALAALAAGVGWQALRGGSAPAARPAPPPGRPWDVELRQPDGSPLVLAGFFGRPVVLNFWATWCPPCVKEMPELDRFYRDFSPKGWQVVGIAIDSPEAVKTFLARQPVGYPIGMAGLVGTDLSRELGNEKGALPFTAVFGADGRRRHVKLGETSYAELAGWAAGG